VLLVALLVRAWLAGIFALAAIIVVIEVIGITAAGAGHVEDDLGGLGGFGGQGGDLRIAGLAVHGRDTVEEELRDVRHGDGVFAGDTVVGDLS
jgi:hypothetical protein